MIDFRYHLVSIVAIFLALTVGIVLGSTVLARPVTETAEAITQNLRDSKYELQQEKAALQQREDGNDEFVKANAERIVGGVLEDQRVLLVEPPDADEELRGDVDRMLKAAGAEVAGRANLRASLFSSEQEAILDKLTESLRPSDVEYAGQASPYERAGELIGYSLAIREPDDVGTESPGSADVLAGMREAGFLTTSGEAHKRATLVLFVAPDVDPDAKGAATRRRSERLLQVLRGLDKYAFGTAVGGKVSSADEPGGLIALLREDALGAEVSSVDTIDMVSGRAVAVYALADEARGKSAGQYGIGTGAGRFMPESPPKGTPTGGS